MSALLTSLPILTPQQQKKLQSLGITTVEEYLGRIWRQPAQTKINQFLQLSAADSNEIFKSAILLVGQDYIEELNKPVKRHPRGARGPKRKP